MCVRAKVNRVDFFLLAWGLCARVTESSASKVVVAVQPWGSQIDWLLQCCAPEPRDEIGRIPLETGPQIKSEQSTQAKQPSTSDTTSPTHARTLDRQRNTRPSSVGHRGGPRRRRHLRGRALRRSFTRRPSMTSCGCCLDDDCTIDRGLPGLYSVCRRPLTGP